jgi:hypothetical protein
MKKAGYIISLCLVLCAGCTTERDINAIMNSWKGSKIDDVIASWGPPSQVIDDSNGGRIMIWTEFSSPTSRGTAMTKNYGSGSSFVNYIPGKTNNRTFWVDGNGIIYKWAWRGL